MENDNVISTDGENLGFRADVRKRAFTLLGAAGITLAVLFASRLLLLFEPLLDKIYYGTLSTILYYIFVLVLFTAYIVALNAFLKKRCKLRLFLPNKEHSMTVPNTLAIIALGAATMFIISACFKFKVKIQIEMGSGVTTATALTNIAVYVYYGLHLWLGLTAAALIDRAMPELIKTPRRVPWGALALVTVFALPELALEFWTTNNLYPLMYYALAYVYAAVYELTDGSFHLTYWACIAIMVL